MKHAILSRVRVLPRRAAMAAAFAVILGAGALACACNVPVFRYALERWSADPYRVTLFHEEALSEAEQELIIPLEEQQDRRLANLDFRAIDVAELDASARKELLASRTKPELPWLVVQYPEYLRIDAPAWTGPLTREAVAGVIDSPVRQELVRRLVGGETAVWLFLESGEPEKDDPAVALLEEELEKLEQTVTLPELSASPEDQLLAAVPLQVAFSVLRIPRDDPAEQVFIETLLHSEPDLAELSQPMVFPVFGRGRALLPLIGAGITAENVHDSASFLVGPCSCQVKELNPGFDLLLSAEWDVLLSQEETPVATLADSATLDDEPELVPIPSGSEAADPELVVVFDETVTVDHTLAVIPNGWIIAGAALIGVLAIVGLIAVVLLLATPQKK